MGAARGGRGAGRSAAPRDSDFRLDDDAGARDRRCLSAPRAFAPRRAAAPGSRPDRCIRDPQWTVAHLPPRSPPTSIAERGRAAARGAPRGGGGLARGGARAPGGPPRAGKREFDRHDATGRGHETEKRAGGGKGNWGAAEGEGGAAAVLSDELAAKASLEGAAADDDAPPPAPAEPEEPQLSLEEYEALVAEKRAGLNRAAKPAAKVDAAQFEGMAVRAKAVVPDAAALAADTGLFLSKPKVTGAHKAGRERERKEVAAVEVGFRVQSEEERRGPAGPEGGRGGRGGRGAPRGGGRGGRGEGRGGGFEGGRGRGEFAPRGRGGRGEGAPRGRGPGGPGRGAPSSGAGAAIKIDDAAAFPSLG